jgi:CHAT domain-containing protein
MYMETVNGRRFRTDAAMQNRAGDMPPDSLTNEWLRLNRQLYMYARRNAGYRFFNPSLNPDQENRKFRLEAQLDSLAVLLRERYPENSMFKANGKEEIAEALSRLSDDEAILEYLVVSGQVYIFIVRNDGVRLVRSLTGPSFMSTLAELSSALRTADDLSFREKTGEVSRALIDPALALLNGIRRLYVIPGRDLESVPLECLVMNGSSHLAERFAVTYHHTLAEVTPDKHLKFNEETAPEPGLNRFLAFSPAFTGDRNLRELGNAAEEVDEIGQMFSACGYVSKIFTEANADEQTLLREAGNGSIVHIATHAKVDRRIPERSGLHLWKQSPAISGDELIDGILEMGEVKGMRFRCRLLTLSACSLEPAGMQDPGSKINLQADFLDAGAQRVLYSLWNVSDRHTRTLMVDFYRYHLQGDDFPEALRKAKVKMMNNPATASPYFWAAFILGAK